MFGNRKAEEYLETAIGALAAGPGYDAVLDQLPVPLYTTDADGVVTYFNGAAARFAGREPRVGEDRWCVTHRIFSTTGEFVPHENCPMAEAIQKKEPVRGRIAITERPDGSRAAFAPYPTPIFREDGELAGAVNMLIDVTDEQSTVLAEQAGRCRRLADATYDRETCNVLGAMAEGFERTAQELCAAKAG
jgi:PAS domain S-box-containing protein